MNILFLGGDKRYIYMAKALNKKHHVYMIGFNYSEFNQNSDAYMKNENNFLNNANINNSNKSIGVEFLNDINIDLSNYDIVIFPISGINDNLEIKSPQGMINLSKNIFENINKNTKFFTGLKSKKLLELIPKEQLISFLDYDEVKKENDFLTIERCS